MAESVFFLLIYTPVAVTVGCWLFFAIQARLTRKQAVVRVLSDNRRGLREDRPRSRLC